MWTIQLQEANGKPAPSFTAGKVKIGRDTDCDLKLSGWRVGNKHAELFVSNDQGFLRDLGTTSAGTLVNGKAVTTHGPLKPTDKIQVGPHAFMATWTPEQQAESPSPVAAGVVMQAPVGGAAVRAAAVGSARQRSNQFVPSCQRPCWNHDHHSAAMTRMAATASWRSINHSKKEAMLACSTSAQRNQRTCSGP